MSSTSSAYGSIQQSSNEDADVQPSSAPASSESKTVDRLMLVAFLMIVFNTMMVGGIVYVGWKAYTDIQETVHPFQAIADYHKNESSASPSAPSAYASAVMDRLSSVMSGTGTFFLFGNATSNVAAFMTNMMRFDFATLATKTETFALAVNKTFANSDGCNLTKVFCNTTSPNGNFQYPALKCPPTTGYPEGRDLPYECYQYPAGQGYTPQPNYWVQCDRIGCPNEGIRTASSAVASMMSKMKDFSLPTAAMTPAAGPASFSSGIFRIDRLFEWAQSQMNVADWTAMGGTCVNFFTELQAVHWSNCYTYGPHQNTSCWDFDDHVAPFFERAVQFCSDVAVLGA